MRVYQFTEQPYFPVWNDHNGSLRVNLPNRKLDPKIAGDLLHRYYDEWLVADELGLDIMVNVHHQTATCMSSTVIVTLAILARQTRNARLLVLGYPIGHRPDPLRCAEELATIDVVSRGRLDMGFIKGVPYEFPASNQNPVGVMDRFWEAHDFIIKAMTSHDAPFNWEGEYFHYRQVNIWPRPVQQPHPPIGLRQVTAIRLGCSGKRATSWPRSAVATPPARSTTPTGRATLQRAVTRRAPIASPISGSLRWRTTRPRRAGAANLSPAICAHPRSCMSRFAIHRDFSQLRTTRACSRAKPRRVASPRTAASSTCIARACKT